VLIKCLYEMHGATIKYSARFSPQHPSWLWDPPSLLFRWYQGLFPGGKAARVWGWPFTPV